MRAKVAKQFTFHAAHRLPHHDGQCRDLHGHSYVLEIAVIGDVKTAPRASDEGMVLDFSVLKDIYKMEIEPFVEHKDLMVTLNNPSVEYPFQTDEGEPGHPHEVPLTTCECLATWMHTVIKERLKDVGDYKVKVKLWETPTSFAVIS